MKFSCLCSTYNRFPSRGYLLEEAVHSFLTQSYPDRELIIINDCPQQQLRLDHPLVTIVNLPRRCRTFGEKCNLAVSLASGDFLVPWDDDDISLPLRLETAAKTLERTGSHYYKSAGQWCATRKGLVRSHNYVGHVSSAYSYKAFTKVGGYPATSWGSDTEIDRKIRQLAPHAVGEVNVFEWQYIYRWGVSNIHLSSMPNEADPELAWRTIGLQPVVAGTFDLAPKWLYDYSQITILAAKSGLSTYPTPDLEFWP
jgi:glycosyltransferase involved in cell wall biosynthesis